MSANNTAGCQVAARPSFKVDSQHGPSVPREFPYPATKLITERHIWVHPSGSPWACLVVGSFYDTNDRELWRIEIILGYRGDSDSSSGSESGSDSEPESPPRISTNLAHRENNTLTGHQHHQYTADGYLILGATTRIDLDSHPFLHKVGAWALAHNGRATVGTTPQFRFNPYIHTRAGMATGGGWNPAFGWDGETGGGPPTGGAAQGGYAQGYGGGFVPGFPAYGAPGYPQAQMMPGQPSWPQQPVYGAAGYDQRAPQPHPRVSFDVPGMNMVNSTGGAGCEPGYNYIFHDEHTKIHVFKSSEPPWRAPGMHYSFAKFQVPTNTTVGELMARFGACNPDPTLNKITEVIEGGGGHWYRGMIFQGDDLDAMGRTLKTCGWDSSRSGREKPVVWLWVTKD